MSDRRVRLIPFSSVPSSEDGTDLYQAHLAAGVFAYVIVDHDGEDSSLEIVINGDVVLETPLDISQVERLTRDG